MGWWPIQGPFCVVVPFVRVCTLEVHWHYLLRMRPVRRHSTLLCHNFWQKIPLHEGTSSTKQKKTLFKNYSGDTISRLFNIDNDQRAKNTHTHGTLSYFMPQWWQSFENLLYFWESFYFFPVKHCNTETCQTSPPLWMRWNWNGTK